jgi:hypothetical protein
MLFSLQRRKELGGRKRIEKGKDVDELKREGSFFLARGKKYY